MRTRYKALASGAKHAGFGYRVRSRGDSTVNERDNVRPLVAAPRRCPGGHRMESHLLDEDSTDDTAGVSRIMEAGEATTSA